MCLPFILWSIAGVPWSQGFLITAPPPVCVPDVIGALAVFIQTKLSTNEKRFFKIRKHLLIVGKALALLSMTSD